MNYTPKQVFGVVLHFLFYFCSLYVFIDIPVVKAILVVNLFFALLPHVIIVS